MQIELQSTSEERYLQLSDEHHVPLFQSPGWAKVKSNWESQLVEFVDRETEQTLGVALLLWINEKALGGYTCYLPHGPVLFLDPTDERFDELATQTVKCLDQFSREKGFKRLRLDPAWINSDHLQKLMHEIGDQYPNVNYNLFPAFRKGQCVYDTMVELEGLTFDEWLARSSRLSYYMRRGERDGVTTRISNDKELLDTFYELLAETMRRHNSAMRPKDYYQRVLDAYDNWFFVIAEYNGEICSMSVNVIYSNCLNHLFAGNRIAYPKQNIPAIMNTVVFREAFNRGCKRITLGGMQEKDDSLYKYKRQFVGDEGMIDLIGVVDIDY